MIAPLLFPGNSTNGPLTCPQPDCDEGMSITHTLDRAIDLSDGLDDLSGPEHAYSQTWSVGCNAGHVLLLPLGDEGGRFGTCPHCGDPGHQPAYAAQECDDHVDDLRRLRQLLKVPERLAVYCRLPACGSDGTAAHP